jgi:pathogenesis-related protein 1
MKIRQNTPKLTIRICGKLMCTGWILLAAVSISAESRVANTPSRAQSPSTIAREMLTIHNAIRAGVQLPPLRWSSELAAFSQKWADSLLAKSRPAHNPDSPYGENIFVAGAGCSPSMVVKEWASEARDYSYRTNSCISDCGHYTQIVWRQTRRVGCAVAHGVNREIWVCSYDPPGNYRDEWPY